jgi:hypothetical protein
MCTKIKFTHPECGRPCAARPAGPEMVITSNSYEAKKNFNILLQK